MYYYVASPTAGNGKINRIETRLRAKLDELGISGEFVKSSGIGDASLLAERAAAKGATTIVAIGGDGTVAEVINGLGQAKAAVGVIPIGHSNLVASHLGITGWEQACDILAQRRLERYDLIGVGSKFFLSTLTIGFETHLEHRAVAKIRSINPPKLREQLTKYREAWRSAQDYQPLAATITVDDNYELSTNFFSITITNQKFDQPEAENILQINIYDKPSRLKLADYIWSMRLGGTGSNRPLARFTAQKLLIKTDPSTNLMADGEVRGRTPIAVRLTDRQIRFIVSRATPGLA